MQRVMRGLRHSFSRCQSATDRRGYGGRFCMIRNGLFTLTSTTAPLSFTTMLQPPHVKTCLARRLRKQIIAKAGWWDSANEKLLHALFCLSVCQPVPFRPLLYHQHMASLDVPPAPRPSEGASPHSSTSRSRTVHSRQMSSLSVNTPATTSQSHHPSESLLHGGERTEQPSQHPPRPDPSYVECRPRFPLVDNIPFSSLDRRRRTIGRVPMCDAYADGVCSRAYFYLSWVSHHWLVSVAEN